MRHKKVMQAQTSAYPMAGVVFRGPADCMQAHGDQACYAGGTRQGLQDIQRMTAIPPTLYTVTTACPAMTTGAKGCRCS